MNRRDLVNAVANHTGRDRKEVDEVLKGFTDVVTAVVAKGEPVAISGFAKFVKVDRPARMGRNPQTGQPVKIKASKKARITPLKAFKDSVMTPSTAPKLTKAGRGTGRPPRPARRQAATKTAAKTPARQGHRKRRRPSRPPSRQSARPPRPARRRRPVRAPPRGPAAKKTTARKR